MNNLSNTANKKIVESWIDVEKYEYDRWKFTIPKLISLLQILLIDI